MKESTQRKPLNRPILPDFNENFELQLKSAIESDRNIIIGKSRVIM
jgi:hypothetical protein